MQQESPRSVGFFVELSAGAWLKVGSDPTFAGRPRGSDVRRQILFVAFHITLFRETRSRSARQHRRRRRLARKCVRVIIERHGIIVEHGQHRGCAGRRSIVRHWNDRRAPECRARAEALYCAAGNRCRENRRQEYSSRREDWGPGCRESLHSSWSRLLRYAQDID